MVCEAARRLNRSVSSGESHCPRHPPNPHPPAQSATATPSSAPVGDREAQFISKFMLVKQQLLAELHKVIIGQDEVIELLLSAIFARGHCLLVGVPGLAKTLHDQHAGQGAAAELQPHPVHARPDAGRHHRHRHPRRGPGDRQAGVPVRPGAGLRQHRAGRRDQPHAAQDAGGAAPGDAGVPGDGRRAGRTRWSRRSSCWPRRTRSSRRAPTRCPRRSSTGSCSW